MSTGRLTLLGTGSSGGVPRIGNDWGDCDPNEPRNRRLRCSVLVETRPAEADWDGEEVTRILIDASPDIREQLLRADVARLDGVVYSHDHADQTHGTDDLRVVAFNRRARVPVWMDEPTAETLVSKFRYCFEGSGGYPAILDLMPFIRPPEPFGVDGRGGAIELQPIVQQHGAITSLGFRIGPVAYCNDVSDLAKDSLALLEGIEVFIVDALRYAPHPSHAHLERALTWARQLGARRTILTNLHIDMDYQTLRAELPAGVEPAYDGLSLEFRHG